jgi:protein tyrosine phosphatase
MNDLEISSICRLIHFFSAGVGRTGVFIALSIVLERMRYEGVVDMFQTVKILRTQRPAMVQTEVRSVFFSFVAKCSCNSCIALFLQMIAV